MEETKVVILSSEKLNDLDILEKYYDEIKEFLDTNLPKNSFITIGNIKNGNLINFLKTKGYLINKKLQHVNSLENSNKKLIRENDMIIFFHYNKSSIIRNFIEYAQNFDSKEIKILNFEH